METEQRTQRQKWMAVLARCDHRALANGWQQLGLDPSYHFVREPEIGLAQVRARMGSTGSQFNIGDVTMTRTVIQLDSGELGYSYITGRDKSHSEIAAVIDALMQTSMQSDLHHRLINPLNADIAKQEQYRAQQVSASKVDFFTMVRGEDE
ncbi:phosphonate C-P lyase system protein PhnG [Photobacterium sp. GB-72]|uniref:phosphonate C-P lyase system protein PhnG n=1 Tax=Photobacterium sp. GB-72 TaxID=2022105 RepID=UPI000D155D84|nr:phosphonate C-P lyase system protein PhnG [Photobacterium sp. GB-72]PSV29244.1 phosphonate C-P lyase system protein PhnG [Photobacterium sp. GB-72]